MSQLLKITCCWKYLLLLLLTAGCSIGVQPESGNPYTLDEALRLGTVDFSPHPWLSRPYQPLIEQIDTLNPGALIELGFLYGGVSQQFLDMTANIARHIRAKLPRTLLGTRFPEHLDISKYPLRTLTCGGGLGNVTFDHRRMAGSKYAQSHLFAWMDPAKPEAQLYFLCLGKFYIDNGFTMIGFTNPSGMLETHPDPDAVIASFKIIQAELNRYATSKSSNAKIYWGGDAATSRRIHTDYAFEPMRVFDTNAWAKTWNNRVARPGIGSKEYSFTLSPKIIGDMKRLANPQTKILFYVDNYDGQDDDLRRFMELDAINRRFLMLESVRLAKSSGVFVSLPLNHCEGCIQADRTGDACHIIPSTKSTSYDALACGDIPTIRDALRLKPR